MKDEKHVHVFMLPAFAQLTIGVLSKIREGNVLTDSEWEAIEILRDAICTGLATFLSQAPVGSFPLETEDGLTTLEEDND